MFARPPLVQVHVSALEMLDHTAGDALTAAWTLRGFGLAVPSGLPAAKCREGLAL
jgi:hypothetical protein